MSFYKFFVKIMVVLTVLISIACTSHPTKSPTPAIESELTLAQKLQYTLDNSLKNSSIQGVSSAIITPNEQIWLGGSGMSDPTIEEQITPEMLFDIGSTGKNSVAALILHLVEEGRFILEDPLRKLLPDHPNIDNNITVRQMLNHTSGIYDFVKNSRSPWQMAYKSTKMWTQEQILADLVDKPYFTPGNGWHYSSTNYILLRMIVEKATGIKVSEEIKNRFLTPLDLDGTIIVDPLAPIPPGNIIANNWIGDIVDLANKPQP